MMKKAFPFFLLLLLGCSFSGAPGEYVKHIKSLRLIIEKNSGDRDQTLQLINEYVQANGESMKKAVEENRNLPVEEVEKVFAPVMKEVERLGALVKASPGNYPLEVYEEYTEIIAQYEPQIKKAADEMRNSSSFFVNRALAEFILLRDLTSQFIQANPLENYAFNKTEAVMNLSALMNIDDEMGIKRQ